MDVHIADLESRRSTAAGKVKAGLTKELNKLLKEKEAVVAELRMAQ
jgi:hypothetical protein